MPDVLNKIGINSRKPWLIFNLLLALLAVSLAIIVSEITLRVLGKTPGYIAAYGLIPVDQIKVLEPPQFVTDEEGVFKANLNYKWAEDIHINSNGFRSRELKPVTTTQKKILFIGDSFTWGSGADPITNSFVDIISRHGYVTFNTGIPGTGPVQYAFLAEKYGPILKPNIIIVIFCMRNDFDSPYPMLPNNNLWHITNAGWLFARDKNGNYLTAQDAYKQYYAKIHGEQNPLQQFLYKSVLGTYFYTMISKIKYKLIGNSNDDRIEYNKNVVRKALQCIKVVADKNKAQLKLFIVPVKPQLIDNYRFSIDSDYHIFKDFRPLIPDFLNEYDYQPDGHFNNSGNRKYAEFILKEIKSKKE